MAVSYPGFSNGQLTDPLAYAKFLVGGRKANTWQSTLAGLDPELARYGVTRTAGTSSYTFNGKSFDLLGAGGTSWSWETPDMRRPSRGAMLTAAERAAALAPKPQPPDTYQDPVDPLEKYRAAIEAANRARRRGASGGRQSTIAAGFSGGTPTTQRATLGGGY